MSTQHSVVSYHTFVFPFLWDDSGKVKLKDFSRKLLDPKWEPDILDSSKIPDPTLYAQLQYFNRAAKNAMFTFEGDSNPVVKNYRYDLADQKGWLSSVKGHDNPVCFVIDKDIYRYDKEQKTDVFDYHFHAVLGINSIRLKLYGTGVGLLVYELENYDLQDEKQITLINEFGRRVFMPYAYDGTCKLCADSVSICQGEKALISDQISGKPLAPADAVPLPETVLFFLRNGEYKVTTSPRHSKKEFFIEPIIDDRMFTACYYINEDFVKTMAQWNSEAGCYPYLRDAKALRSVNKSSTAKQMYELMFIDGDGMSCHSRDMLHKLLEENIYTRWLEYGEEADGSFESMGTVTGITDYSLVSVSTSGFVANAFLTLYIEMSLLVLAQRASLLAFERRISDSARGRMQIGKIQRDYVMFQSQLLLREVTPQQQGIETYDLLLEKLMIHKIASDIEAQINALFNQRQLACESADNVILFILACFGVFEVMAFFCEPNWMLAKIAFGIVAILIGIFLFIHKKLK